MKDKITKGISKNGFIRYLCVNSTNLVEDANQLFQTQPTSIAALGRVLSLTAIMGSELKSDSSQVVVTINGGGEAGTIMAIGKANGDVKGFISNPNCHDINPVNGKLNVGKIVGTNGYLSVSLEDYDHQPFVSKVALQTGEIGEDFAYYYALSAQVPSIVSVGVLVDVDYHIKSAGALIAQLMPGHSESDIQYLELVAQTLQPISSYVANGYDSEAIIKVVDSEATILDSQDVRYHCDCNRDTFYKALVSLSADDIKDLLQKDGQIEMTCTFCNHSEVFKEEDLKDLIHEN